MEVKKKKEMTDELIIKGYDLALKMLEEGTEEVSDDQIIIDCNDRYPEKLAAISGFIEAIVKSENSSSRIDLSL
ncbi:hypothetical protein [Enterococcus avium]|uniref:hypothetical protein n=1 Tax=Enterococcus avium TaxID=33945 RepID=UPI000F4FB7F2|nr:hypothetical protein [Enterococcus avium]MDT2493408.1 hypothetical protein [Enterococcus avium]ROZ43613.1 hypothetical protein EGX28_07270 [Enterococcus avium]